jgi:hypothetical protein
VSIGSCSAQSMVAREPASSKASTIAESWVPFLDGTISAAETSFALHSEALKGISRSRAPEGTLKHPVKLAASETGVISAERSFSRMRSETTASRPD